MEAGIVADFEHMSLLLFAVIFTINVGLIAADTSNTGVSIFEGSGISPSLTYADLNSAFYDTRPPESATEKCVGWIECFVASTSDITSSLIYGLQLITGVSGFMLKNLPLLIAGYHFLLMHVADLIEGASLGPIHMMFMGISGVILIALAYGLWTIAKSIASIVRGGGG